MSIEVATYVGDLQPVNPPSTDPRSQGADHLRLIKQVLQNSFPGLEKAIYFSTTTAKSANFNVAATDMNNEFLVATTGGAVTATLPSGLGTADAGWKCYFRKTTSADTNPLFIAPATGTLTSGAVSGLAQARRCIPGVKIEALWIGNGWIISRAISLPIGSMITFNSASLPAGYEWPNGQTLSSSANYPEYNAVVGSLVTMDLRGYTEITLDNLGGSAAGRLNGGVITGTAVGNVGGSDVVTLSSGQIPAHQHAVFLHENAHSHTVSLSGSAAYGAAGGGPSNATTSGVYTTSSVTTGITVGSVNGVANDNLTAANAGGGGAHSNVQPSIMCAKILVVE